MVTAWCLASALGSITRLRPRMPPLITLRWSAMEVIGVELNLGSGGRRTLRVVFLPAPISTRLRAWNPGLPARQPGHRHTRTMNQDSQRRADAAPVHQPDLMNDPR